MAQAYLRQFARAPQIAPVGNCLRTMPPSWELRKHGDEEKPRFRLDERIEPVPPGDLELKKPVLQPRAGTDIVNHHRPCPVR